MSSKISRRRFLETGAIAAAGLTVVPSSDWEEYGLYGSE